MKIQRTQNRQNNFEKDIVEGLILPDLKTYYRATEIKAKWHEYMDK